MADLDCCPHSPISPTCFTTYCHPGQAANVFGTCQELNPQISCNNGERSETENDVDRGGTQCLIEHLVGGQGRAQRLLLPACAALPRRPCGLHLLPEQREGRPRDGRGLWRRRLRDARPASTRAARRTATDRTDRCDLATKLCRALTASESCTAADNTNSPIQNFWETDVNCGSRTAARSATPARSPRSASWTPTARAGSAARRTTAENYAWSGLSGEGTSLQRGVHTVVLLTFFLNTFSTVVLTHIYVGKCL